MLAPRFAALLVIASLAGCTLGPSDGLEGSFVSPSDGMAGPATFTDDTGGIEGLVTDDQLQPIPFAAVALDSLGAMTTTDTSGGFSFSRVPPGEKTLTVSAAGFRSTGLPVIVTAAQLVRANVVLTPLPVEEPFHVTYHRTQTIRCEYALNVSLGTTTTSSSSCDLNLVAPSTSIFEAANWTGFNESIAETSWRSTQALGSERSVLLWARIQPSGGDRVHFWYSSRDRGTSPLRTQIDQADFDAGINNANKASDQKLPRCGEGSKCSFEIRHYAARTSTGITLTTFQTIDDYMTQFFWAPAPVGFSSLPDS